MIIYENFKSVFFFTYLRHTKTWGFAYLFGLNHYSHQNYLEVLSLGNM